MGNDATRIVSEEKDWNDDLKNSRESLVKVLLREGKKQCPNLKKIFVKKNILKISKEIL